MHNSKRLSLINYEGDCIWAVWINNDFMSIMDQWDVQVAIFTYQDLVNFVQGRTTVVDSKGKVWNYSEEHQNAKPTEEAINKFFSKSK